MRFAVLLAILLGPVDIRTRAWDALQSQIKDEKTLNHSRAVEAIMRELAPRKTDRDEWGLSGLLHDIDIATTKDDLSGHGLVGAKMLRELGFSDVVVYAVSAHDDRAGIPRRSPMDHALYCADQLYWLMNRAGSREQAERSISPKLSAECEQSGRTLPQVFTAAAAGIRKADRRR